jgi:hypothetical protein
MKNVYNVIPNNGHIQQLDGSKTLFKKQLIRFGEWIDPLYPEDVMRIDAVFLAQLVKNFKAGVPGRIPVPLTHTDNPEYNTGELTDLTIEGDGSNIEDGLYGTLDIRRASTADDIRNDLIFDVSISFTDNYQDNENGALYGPTLLHVALVNNPYIKKMSPFTALAEMLSKQFGGAKVHALSESTSKETTMSKVKNDREFPVDVVYSQDGKDVEVTIEPGTEVEVPAEAVEAVQKLVAEAAAPEIQETDEEKTAREAQEAEVARKAKEELDAAHKGDLDEDTNLSESAKLQRQLSEANAKLRAKEVDEQYQTARGAGKIVPAQEAAFRGLAEALHGQTRSLSDGKTQNLSELLAEFISKAPKVVSLDEENGAIEDDSTKGPVEKLSDDQRKGLQAMRVSDEDYAKYGAKESVSINDLGA